MTWGDKRENSNNEVNICFTAANTDWQSIQENKCLHPEDGSRGPQTSLQGKEMKK